MPVQVVECRDVAQPGRALAWGARGRQFKSARPDQQSFGDLRATRSRPQIIGEYSMQGKKKGKLCLLPCSNLGSTYQEIFCQVATFYRVGLWVLGRGVGGVQFSARKRVSALRARTSFTCCQRSGVISVPLSS